MYRTLEKVSDYIIVHHGDSLRKYFKNLVKSILSGIFAVILLICTLLYVIDKITTNMFADTYHEIPIEYVETVCSFEL